VSPIKTEEFTGFVHSAGEVNWWNGKEERQKHKNLRSQETSRIAGFVTIKETRSTEKASVTRKLWSTSPRLHS
jgi:hypothetical protein